MPIGDHEVVSLAGSFARPSTGPRWDPVPGDLPFTGLPGWQSNGGPHRGHPARALPFSLVVPVPESQGRLIRILLIGCFALWSGREFEVPGTQGASVQIGDEKGGMRLDLVNGRHYGPAEDLSREARLLGDGTSFETVGQTEINGVPVRVDCIGIDVPDDIPVGSVRFRDMGTPASFVLFDVLFQFAQRPVCPFAAAGGGIALSEVPSIVRLRDRVRFGAALRQLQRALLSASDLDEARSQSLTFIAVVVAAMLELGAGRHMHRVQLEAARRLEGARTLAEIAEESERVLESATREIFARRSGPNEALIDRALAIVERNYAKNLSDSSVAAQLGLSNSHFRHLFKQTTGQPFHQYLIAVRLEHARQMLLDQDISVSQVASAVGFQGLSHFSRAFTQRFQVSPTRLRRQVG